MATRRCLSLIGRFQREPGTGSYLWKPLRDFPPVVRRLRAHVCGGLIGADLVPVNHCRDYLLQRVIGIDHFPDPGADFFHAVVNACG